LGEADRDLLAARRGAGEEQVRDVGAGDQENQADDREEQRRGGDEAGPGVARERRFRHRHDVDVAALVVDREVALEPGRDRLQVRLRLADRGPRLEAADAEDRETPPFLVPVDLGVRPHHLVHRHRHPELRLDADERTLEGRRGDADDRERRAVDPDRAAERLGLGP